MGIFDFLKNRDEAVKVSGYKMVTERGEGFYAYNGNLYASDIVRSCIRPVSYTHLTLPTICSV